MLNTQTISRRLRLSCLTAALLASATAAASAAKPGEVLAQVGGSCGTLSAAGATWSVCDNRPTDNGLPAGGTGGQCLSGAPGTGSSLDDATFDGRGDAFDGGASFWVNNIQIGGVGSYTATSAVFAAQTVAGLTTQLFYDAMPTQPTLRTFLSLTNPGAAPITVNVDYATNFGSDSDTRIESTASGDTLFTTTDQWAVTSDGGPSDPVNTTVMFSGNPPVRPSAVSTVVFSCSGDQGLRATYPVTVPAGATVGIVTFQRLGSSVAQATADAAEFNNIQASSPLFADLTPQKLSEIRNMVISVGGGFPPPVPRPAVVPVGGYSSALLALIMAGIGLLSLGLMRRR